MNDLERLQSSAVLILGYGVNNQALAKYLLKYGVRVTIRDAQPEVVEAGRRALAEYEAHIEWQCVPDITKETEGFDIIFRTPAIPLHMPGLQKAIARGAEVTSQTELFLKLCPASTVGVTGTKGKGTTSSLIYHMLQAGYTQGKTYLGGNIGLDPFSFLDEVREEDVVILELSSFQLENTQVSPHIAVMLHVTPDHLDHHRNLEEYKRAKGNILLYQRPNDLAIINGEYADMKPYLQMAQAKVYTYTRHQPQQQAAWAETLEGKEVVFVQIGSNLESFEITSRRLLGEHNLENILPAAMVGAYFCVSPRVMQQVITSFKGLEHRLSLVGEFDSVAFYDDSIATTPESCMVAIEAFTGRRVHLIIGGKNKGQYHEELADTIASRCATVSFMPGVVSQTLRKVIQRAIRRFETKLQILPIAAEPVMETILSGIHAHLRPGDVVLLSPAAASDTPFANYKERGEAFSAAVTKRYGGEHGSR